MALDASVALSVKDNLSAAVVAMKNSMTAFRSDVVELQKELQTLSNSKASIRLDMNAAQIQLKKTKQAFQELGEEASDAERQAAKADWRQAEKNLENIRQQYELVSKQVRQTTRDFEQASGAISRADNRAGSAAKSGGILSAMGQAGAWSMAGDVASQWANTLVSSYGGSEVGTLFSSALSGAGSGAAIGTMIAPGVGTVVGAGLGGLVGLVSGGSQIYEQQDDAFKSYYQQLYEQGQAAEDESLTSGSATAAQRELDAIAFDRLLNGQGASYLSDLRAMAADTPMEYEDLTNMSRALATGFGDTPERMLELMEAIGDAGSAVGVTAADMTTMAQAMSRMQSSGKAALEYLNIFQDRGVDVIGMLSEAMGKSQGEIYEMISDGDIRGQRAVDIIQAGMEVQFGGAMETMAKTYDGLTSTLEDTMTELDASRGNAYNETRKMGLEAEAQAYSGELGAAVAELNRIAGVNEAMLENRSEQFTREALSAVLLGDQTTPGLFTDEQMQALEDMRGEFVQASMDYEAGSQEAGIKMDNLRQQAEALATAAYESSTAYQGVQEAELDLIGALRELTATVGSAAWMTPYLMNQELSKGQASTYSLEPSTGISPRSSGSNYHRAFGLPRVPFDNYPAVLHEGERVLTAREARAMDRASAMARQDEADSLVQTYLLQAESPTLAAEPSAPEREPSAYNGAVDSLVQPYVLQAEGPALATEPAAPEPEPSAYNGTVDGLIQPYVLQVEGPALAATEPAAPEREPSAYNGAVDSLVQPYVLQAEGPALAATEPAAPEREPSAYNGAVDSLVQPYVLQAEGPALAATEPAAPEREPSAYGGTADSLVQPYVSPTDHQAETPEFRPRLVLGDLTARAQAAAPADSQPSRVINIDISGNSFGAGQSAEEIAQRLADLLELKLAAGVL